MRPLLLSSVAALGALVACAGPPAPIDWQAWLSAERSIGRMRDDPAPLDAPFDNATLARNFRTIAFEVERDPFGTGAAPQGLGASQLLRRWHGPVLWAVYASPAEQARVRPLVHGFSARLAGLTGLAIRPAGREASMGPRTGPRTGPTAQPANLQIWVVPDAIGGFIETLPGGAPETGGTGEPAEQVRARIAEFIRIWYGATASPCAAQFFNVDRPAAEAGTILGALVLIRAGLPEALLRSCVEEELTQSMGLPNDDAGVRPSIFNDEKEFGVLTAHDELLLRVLYDRRLAPGMPPETAMPVVRRDHRRAAARGVRAGATDSRLVAGTGLRKCCTYERNRNPRASPYRHIGNRGLQNWAQGHLSEESLNAVPGPMSCSHRGG